MGFLANSFARGFVEGANDQFADARVLQGKQDLADQTVNARAQYKFAEEKAKAKKMLNFRQSLQDGMGVDPALAVQISRMPNAMEMDGAKLGEFVKNFAPVQGQFTAPETQTREVLQKGGSRSTGLFSPDVTSKQIGYTTGENLPSMQKYEYKGGAAKNDDLKNLGNMPIPDNADQAAAQKLVIAGNRDPETVHKAFLGGTKAPVAQPNDGKLDDTLRAVANGTVDAANAPEFYKSIGGRNTNVNWSAVKKNDDPSKKFEYRVDGNTVVKIDKTNPDPTTAVTFIENPELRTKQEEVKSRQFMASATTSLRQLGRVEQMLKGNPLAVGLPADIASVGGGYLTQVLNIIYGVEKDPKSPRFAQAITDFGEKSADFKNNMNLLVLNLADGILKDDRINVAERKSVEKVVEGLKSNANFQTSMNAFTTVRNVYLDRVVEDIKTHGGKDLALPDNIKNDEATWKAYRQKLIDKGFVKEDAELTIDKLYRQKHGLL